MSQLRIGQEVTIKSLALEYSDYQNIKGVLSSIDGETLNIAIPEKALTVEDERELHHEAGKVFVKVKRNQVH